LVYDIEFDAKDQEYSYTIDANSGDILEKSSEPVYD
ncbi:TPA: PepSY domain-containing protein, partial [Streptococcus equi subsp. zooepidemicus]|nr:PepSY domain-containing protein [Streptococcus equi subsp. zooepidemicus]